MLVTVFPKTILHGELDIARLIFSPHNGQLIGVVGDHVDFGEAVAQLQMLVQEVQLNLLGLIGGDDHLLVQSTQPKRKLKIGRASCRERV